MRRVCVLMAFVCVLLVPSVARADGLESFVRGFNDLVGNGPKEKVMSESDTQRDLEPVVIDESETMDLVTAPAAPPTLLGQIQSFFSNLKVYFLGMVVSFGSGGLWNIVVRLFIVHPILITLPAGLVFMWWGVRKSKQIIWTAFRTGRLNLATSVKRVWYRRKAKEWYG